MMLSNFSFIPMSLSVQKEFQFVYIILTELHHICCILYREEKLQSYVYYGGLIG